MDKKNPISTPTLSSSSPAPRKVTYLPTTAAYERWAQVYDNDSNPLQALDDLQLITLLPDFLTLVSKASDGRRTTIVDLGCGTGRNTLKLLSVPQSKIIGLDASANMLRIARTRCAEHHSTLPEAHRAENADFELFDMLGVASCWVEHADAVISTLVLEHIPLDQFFSTAAGLLKPNGYLLLTNMHADMGAISQAGFLDPASGEKVRPTSYAHRIDDVLAEADRCGFHLIDRVQEKAVERDMLDRVGGRGEKWIGIRCWFGMVLRRGREMKGSNEVP